MQDALQLLLAAVLAIAALAAWLGFTGRRRYYRRYRVVAALGFLAITPALVFILWRQTRAPSVIADWGIALHPATVEAQGFPTIRADGGAWIFSIAAHRDSIREFYLDSLHVRGWRLALVHPSTLLFERNDAELMIRIRDGWRHASVVYDIGPRLR